MESCSYHHLINKYNAELGLAITKRWQYGKDERIVPKTEGPSLSRTQVLHMIFLKLEKAKVFSLNVQSCQMLKINIEKYVGLACRNEINEVKKLACKIDKLIQTRGNAIMSCSIGSYAEKINQLLDKPTASLSSSECNLLCDLANAMANTRFSAFCFYHKISIMKLTHSLKKECPNVIFFQEDDFSLPVITYSHPTDMQDCMSALQIELFYFRNSDLSKVDSNFIKEMIKVKLKTQDLSFKQYLNERLMLHVIYAFIAKWDEIEKDLGAKDHLLNVGFETPPAILNLFTSQLLHEPPSYIELKDQKDLKLSPLDSPEEFVEIAKELKVYYHDTDLELDNWYSGIYQKLTEYKKLNDSFKLPLLTPTEYKKYENFVDSGDIDIPLRADFEQWEREIAKELNAPKINVRSSKSKQPKKSPSDKKTKNPKRKFKVEYVDEEPESFASVIATPVARETKSEPIEKAVKEIVVDIEPPKPRDVFIDEIPHEGIHALLLNASPFAVKGRVTRWFNPNSDLEILNDDSLFVHNFAWAAQVAWEVGLRYYRTNEQGHYEPAIALLCDVDRNLYSKPELFLITLTFDHNVDENNLNNFDFDPKWECYHRALTRRDQENDIVNEYMMIAKDRCVDFPALPSQTSESEQALMHMKKVYPDRSFIESIKGSVITIRDPKYDTRHKKCRLRLFGIQNL